MSLGTALFAVWLGLLPPPQIGHLQMPQQYWLWTLEAAEATRTNPYHLVGIMAIESRFDPLATSGGGSCIGLMQLHRDTARIVGVDPHDPRENILGGARVLARLMNRPGKLRNNLPAAIRDYNGTGNKAYLREVKRAIRQAERGK